MENVRILMMDLAKAKEDPLYNRARYWFVLLLKERFRNKTDDTLEKFYSLMQKHMEKEIDTNNLILEVNTLFNGHPDLISEFNHFIPRDLPQSTSIEHGSEKYAYLDEQLHKSAIEACLDYACRARLILQDDNQFEALVDVLIRFREHEDIDQVREEAFPLLKEHPGLEIELSKFLAVTVETRHNKKGNDILAFHEVRNDDFINRALTEQEEKFLDCEDEMYESDMEFHATESALEAVKKLILENSEREPEEIINMRKYFSSLNVKRLKELKLRKFLFRGTKTRYEVIRRSEMIVSNLKTVLKDLKKQRRGMKKSMKKRMRLI